MEEDNNGLPFKFTLSEEHLKALSMDLPELKAETRKFQSLFADLTDEEWARIIPADFSWAPIYELSMVQGLLLLLASLGALSAVSSALEGSKAPVEDFIEAIRKFEPGDPNDGTWNGGDGGIFQKHDVVALVVVMSKQIECLGTFGKYLSDLVQDVRDNSEESFIKAVRIDPTILACEPFAAYMSKRHLRGKDDIFHLIGNGLRGKWKKPASHFNLRVILQAAFEGGLLEKLSALSEADRFFIQELRIYSDKGEDPARSLLRFISRWKASRFNK